MFKDYRPEIPKSRRKKSKLKVVGADGAAVFDATPKTEEINPGYHVHVKAALAAHGIEVENTQKATLSAIDSPETRGFCRYAEQTKLLSIIKGIEKSIFHDGQVRSAQWNQLVARSGRIIPREPQCSAAPPENGANPSGSAAKVLAEDGPLPNRNLYPGHPLPEFLSD